MTIDGKIADTVSTFDVVNPATGQVAAQAPECSAAQLDAAMESAAQAYRGWRLDEDVRRKSMLELADAIVAHAGELTAALVMESGKPVPMAAMEPGICVAWLQYYAGMEMPRETLQDDDAALIEVAYRPLGVVAAITPWNFPLGLAMWKIAPALRAGNTVVLKSSPFTPLASLAMGEIMGEILPPGVVNTLSGGDALGAAMTAHRIPRKVTFTGSVAAGKKVAVSAGADLKRLTLELGGNDAAVILDDADVEAAAAKLVPLAFFNTGQACALPKRIFAPAGRYDEVVDAFAAVADSMVVGDPHADTTQLGPLSTRPQFERVSGLVAEAITQGARAAAGGSPVKGSGYFFRPTVLADLAEGYRIVDEEQFGPALPILRYETVDEAVERANDTEFGLCGSVWSNDVGHATAVAEQLEVGTTFVNTHAALLPTVQFGGAKASGLGVENGIPGLLSFTDAQVVHTARA
jgi:acyl-CoA reductase-like NAD-dependent aldehyde dehydrogenase